MGLRGLGAGGGRNRKKVQLDGNVQEAPPRTGTSGPENEGEAATLRVGSSGKGGQRRKRGGKKTPENNKEQGNEATRRQKKEGPQEEAPRLDHQGRRTQAGRGRTEENRNTRKQDEEEGKG